MKIATIGIVPREANEQGRDRFYSSTVQLSSRCEYLKIDY